MLEVLATADWRIAAISLAVGVVVGLCGLGGGALLTPALLALDIPATTAVANDLVAAAGTKSVGAVLHWKAGHAIWPLAGWLTLGSVPGAFAGARLLHSLPAGLHPETFAKAAIGWALVAAASLYAIRQWLTSRTQAGRAASVTSAGLPVADVTGDVGRIRPTATVLVGLIGGFTVGLTSVGAGSIMMTAIMMLHPRLHPLRLVGTDLVQATPLVFAAALGHISSAPIDWTMVALLALGGMPGAYVGARLSSRVPVPLVRTVVIVVLGLTGVALAGPWALLLGAAVALTGPLQRRSLAPQ